MFGVQWELVPGVKYQGDPVFQNPRNGELAYEPLGSSHLVALPAAIEVAIRSGKQGDLY